MKKIILASASPRRKELLEKIGLKFAVESSDFKEQITTSLEPQELVMKNSLAKARAVANKHRKALVIAADTIGVFRGKILGKPRAAAGARKMLQALSGKSHLVITGVTIIDTESGKVFSKSVTTKVYFKKLSSKEIEDYVKTGEPLDKAGAYAIQGLGSVIVAKIEGDYYNVIGLPLNALAEGLKQFGVAVL
jgi:septum formation protein